MAKGPKKLVLHRETLCALTGDELGDIHGGTAPAITVPLIGASVRFCKYVPAIVRAAPVVYQTFKKVTEYQPNTNDGCATYTFSI